MVPSAPPPPKKVQARHQNGAERWEADGLPGRRWLSEGKMLNRRLLGEEEADRELLFEPPQTTNFSSVTARGAGAPHPSRSPLARGAARGPGGRALH